VFFFCVVVATDRAGGDASAALAADAWPPLGVEERTVVVAGVEEDGVLDLT